MIAAFQAFISRILRSSDKDSTSKAREVHQVSQAVEPTSSNGSKNCLFDASKDLERSLAAYKDAASAQCETLPNIDAVAAKEVIATAERIVLKGGLAESLSKLWDEVKYWGAWKAKVNFKPNLEADNIEVLETKEPWEKEPKLRPGGKRTRVTFDYRGIRYSISLRELSAYTNEAGVTTFFGEIDLTLDGQVVLCCNMERVFGPGYRWPPVNTRGKSTVISFDARNEIWMKDLVEMSSEIQNTKAFNERNKEELALVERSKNIIL